MTAVTAAVIGGGPAGLMAAETLAAAGLRVSVFERMPSVGRKLLIAGRGGLNLTHSEPLERFLARYGAAAERLRPIIEAYPPQTLVAWAEALGQPTFVGTSGRIFPKAMKASPLLRAWLARLAALGVTIHTRAEWTGWDEAGAITFADGQVQRFDAVVLALGGASWPRLGSTGAWAEILARRGLALAPFRPANCGFEVRWSEPFRTRFAGAPLKPLALSFEGRALRGEAMVAAYGLEGGAIYALSAPLRDAIERDGRAVLHLDLRPDLTEARLRERLAPPRGGQSMANFLRKAAGLSPVAIGLVREANGGELPSDLAAAIKDVRVTLTAPRGLDRAISSAGGLAWSEVDETLMLRPLPGVFVAGEMLDWEAPTGGYLLQGAFATGRAAAEGVLTWLGLPPAPPPRER
ncbi:aminoacetone oxidase family FAD-binding enzyme [Phenylobacterium soli]|uniref:Aminoacetone oxidase family FAD-binding enzyme n=1 Tax=Phenylobacterium soli TaxID=2170551 RepID=A0A328ANZ9_9CAUL|nr:TIGR03862 family flavoprotein [Phenylobacterium soli]RAK56041.1 aminoacetone oxidase family FAD-binding enzyme [Phenylobacterium soli]